MNKLTELLEYAKNRRDDELVNGTLNNVIYWNGYIDAITRIAKEVQHVYGV